MTQQEFNKSIKELTETGLLKQVTIISIKDGKKTVLNKE